jgi:hypothetical protein
MLLQGNISTARRVVRRMKTSFAGLVLLAASLLFGAATVAAQTTPTPSPAATTVTTTPVPTSPAATAVTSTPTAPPTIRTAPPAPTGTPTPSFNFDEVKEVVSELRGSDGRIHYVTLSEDTEGAVRIRLSLFEFPASSYNAVLFRNGDCSKTATFGPGDALGSFPFTLTERSGLVLTFFNTRVISITAGSPNSIYDSDGTSLAVYVPGDSGIGPVACGRLDVAPGAPRTGDSATGRSSRTAWPLFAGAALLAAAALAVSATRLRR